MRNTPEVNQTRDQEGERTSYVEGVDQHQVAENVFAFTGPARALEADGAMSAAWRVERGRSVRQH